MQTLEMLMGIECGHRYKVGTSKGPIYTRYLYLQRRREIAGERYMERLSARINKSPKATPSSHIPFNGHMLYWYSKDFVEFVSYPKY